VSEWLDCCVLGGVDYHGKAELVSFTDDSEVLGEARMVLVSRLSVSVY